METQLHPKPKVTKAQIDELQKALPKCKIRSNTIELTMPSSTLYAVLLALVLGVGCGKKEPELSTEKVITPDEAANKLFVEAVELVSEAKSKEGTNLTLAIKSYEEAAGKVRKIVSDYKESDIAVKLVSDEALLKGESMVQIEGRVRELQREKVRQAKEAERLAEAERVKKLKLEEKVVGEYEYEQDGDTFKGVFLENGTHFFYTNGKKSTIELKWEISKDGELHIEHLGNFAVFRINPNESLTKIAYIIDGKLNAIPKEEQFTTKRIK